MWSRGTAADQRTALRRAEKLAGLMEGSEDILMRLSSDFGILSMTFVVARRRPWLVCKLPQMIRRYRLDIDALRLSGADDKTAFLHEALLSLYLGRMRVRYLGFPARHSNCLRSWVLAPFRVAVNSIVGAGDIHLHSSVDIHAYYTLALAQVGESVQAASRLEETERLCALLKDRARTEHWNKQRAEIHRLLQVSRRTRRNAASRS